MSRIICTFPGRYGDALWALPTIRAISEAAGAPVDLVIAGEFASMLPILKAPYLGKVWAEEKWSLTPPNEWHAPIDWRIQERYNRIISCGYRGWPSEPLPQFIYAQTQREYPDLPMAPLSLERAWLTQDVVGWQQGVTPAVGWSETYVELKVGLLTLLGVWTHLQPNVQNRWRWVGTGGRWDTEGGLVPATWTDAAFDIAVAPFLLTDCSALHVLACALGVPVLLYEPMDARHNPIFYPFGKGERPGDRVYLITGSDGLPTQDARHTADAIRAALERAK